MANNSNIMARFMSLMDVSILLLGLFMVLFSIAKFEDIRKEIEAKEGEEISHLVKTSIEKNFGFILIFGACESNDKFQEGHCYRIEEDYQIGDEVNMESSVDLKEDIERIERGKRKVAICLVTKKGAWDAAWTDEKIQQLKNAWGHDVYRVMNVDFSQVESVSIDDDKEEGE